MDIETQLERDEGCVLHAYQDHLGYWTIGIGTLIDKRKGGGITRAEALFLLKNRISKVEFDLVQSLPWISQIDRVRYYALVNMAFNLGVKGLLGFKNTLKAVKRGDWEEAAIGIMNSLYAAQVPERAERIAKQMLSGQWI
jgi:lysozyme